TEIKADLQLNSDEAVLLNFFIERLADGHLLPAGVHDYAWQAFIGDKPPSIVVAAKGGESIEFNPDIDRRWPTKFHRPTLETALKEAHRKRTGRESEGIIHLLQKVLGAFGDGKKAYVNYFRKGGGKVSEEPRLTPVPSRQHIIDKLIAYYGE